MPGLLQLAEIDALIKALTTIKGTIEGEVKVEAFDIFYTQAHESGKQPPNFRGVDGIASASIEMRKRGTGSALSDDEVTLLTENKIPVEKIVTTPRMFGINPAYEHDEKLLALVSKKLEKVVPEDFIVIQDEVSKNVVGEETIEKAFASKATREVISAVVTMAIKPKLEVVDIQQIINDVTAIIVPKK